MICIEILNLNAIVFKYKTSFAIYIKKSRFIKQYFNRNKTVCSIFSYVVNLKASRYLQVGLIYCIIQSLETDMLSCILARQKEKHLLITWLTFVARFADLWNVEYFIR